MLKHRKYIENNPKYNLIERKVTGPKITNKKTVGKNAIEKELEALKAPGP